MPHLDANALVEDRKGLEFLAGVLDVPADHPAPCWEGGGELPAAVASQPIVQRPTRKRSRKTLVLVPEAA